MLPLQSVGGEVLQGMRQDAPLVSMRIHVPILLLPYSGHENSLTAAPQQDVESFHSEGIWQTVSFHASCHLYKLQDNPGATGRSGKGKAGDKAIGANETVIINLPSASSEILNRVLGSEYSQLLGNLSCNGVFILINSNGIYIGPNANIDVGSIILSTRDIDNQDFLDGNYLFRKLTQDQLDMLLLNEGTINIREGGFGVLIAGGIENRGKIIANVGKVALASGDAVRVEFEGNSLISVAVEEAVASTIYDFDGNPITDQIKNTGTIEAGTVILDAESLSDIFTKAINLDGIVRANAIEAASNGSLRIFANGTVGIAGQLYSDYLEIGFGDEIDQLHGRPFHCPVWGNGFGGFLQRNVILSNF